MKRGTRWKRENGDGWEDEKISFEEKIILSMKILFELHRSFTKNASKNKNKNV